MSGIYVMFAPDRVNGGEHIRKWSREPFEGASHFELAAAVDRRPAMEEALIAAREQMAIAFADPERLINSETAMNDFALAMEQVREVLGDR